MKILYNINTNVQGDPLHSFSVKKNSYYMGTRSLTSLIYLLCSVFCISYNHNRKAKYFSKNAEA